MIESVEETLRAAEKRVEICQHDLARAEAVLVGVRLVISALERHQEEMRRRNDELDQRHWKEILDNERNAASDS